MKDKNNNLTETSISSKICIVNSKIKRKKVIAKERIKKGINILKEEAFASVINEKLINSYCSNCFKGKEKLFICSRCKYVKYCSKTCQKNNFKYHKSECIFMNDHPETKQNTHYRLINQLLIKMKENPKLAESVNGLIEHVEEYKKRHNGEIEKDMYQYAYGLKMYSNYNDDINNLISLIIRVNVNSLGIFDTVRNNQFGRGIFLKASMINHDCNPNCIYFFEDNKIIVRTIRTIEKDEEITISYMPLYQSVRERRKYLNENYYFECNCKRCEKYKESPELDTLEGIKCTTPNCNGYISHVIFNACPICHTIPSQEHKIKIKKIINNYEAFNKDINDLSEQKKIEENNDEMRKYFHPNNVYIEKNISLQRIKLEKMLTQLYGSISDEDQNQIQIQNKKKMIRKYKEKFLKINSEHEKFFNNDVYKNIFVNEKISVGIDTLEFVLQMAEDYCNEEISRLPAQVVRSHIQQLVEKYRIRDVVRKVRNMVKTYGSDSFLYKYVENYLDNTISILIP